MVKTEDLLSVICNSFTVVCGCWFFLHNKKRHDASLKKVGWKYDKPAVYLAFDFPVDRFSTQSVALLVSTSACCYLYVNVALILGDESDYIRFVRKHSTEV